MVHLVWVTSGWEQERGINRCNVGQKGSGWGCEGLKCVCVLGVSQGCPRVNKRLKSIAPAIKMGPSQKRPLGRPGTTQPHKIYLPHSADLWFCIVARDPAPRIDPNRPVGASTIGAVREPGFSAYIPERRVYTCRCALWLILGAVDGGCVSIIVIRF